MFRNYTVFLVVGVAACAIVVSTLSAEKVFLERSHDFSKWSAHGWTRVSPAPDNSEMIITFALKQRNVDHLERLLLDRSDPNNPDYGRYLTVDQLTELIQPSSETVTVVGDWLRANGVDSCDQTRNRDFLVCRTEVFRVKDLLSISELNVFSHPSLEQKLIRTLEPYRVPHDVAPHLDFIGGLIRFPRVTRTRHLDEATYFNSKGIGVHIGVTPGVIRQLYQVNEVGSNPNNSQVVAQFLEQYFRPTDLKEFMTLYVHGYPHLTEVAKVVGPNGAKAGIEASLDVQYIMGVGANVPTWFWSSPGRTADQEPFLEWIVAVGNTSSVPFVHSVSYGDNEDSLSVEYMQRINVEFMKAGLRGLTILFASGDDGAGCMEDNSRFRPSFPASSPYVTTVGGTDTSNPFTISTEKAAGLSGGGFSNVFARPVYQEAAVSKFLNQTNVPSKYYNAGGRGYPDVAALSMHFWVVNNLIPLPGVAGTSASTPSVAGIVSLVNDARLNAGLPVLGFLNPFLYQNGPKVLLDIKQGCHEGCLSHDTGFCASEGWDPTTGFGSPLFPELVKKSLDVLQHVRP